MDDDDKVYTVRCYESDKSRQEDGFTVLGIWRGIQVILASWIPLGLAMKLDGWLGRHELVSIQGQPPIMIEGGPGVCVGTVLFIFAIIMYVVQYTTWKKYSGRIL